MSVVVIHAKELIEISKLDIFVTSVKSEMLIFSFISMITKILAIEVVCLSMHE